MSRRPHPHSAPSLAAFERMAEQAFESLPQAVRTACSGLAIRVVDFAPDDILELDGDRGPVRAYRAL